MERAKDVERLEINKDICIIANYETHVLRVDFRIQKMFSYDTITRKVSFMDILGYEVFENNESVSLTKKKGVVGRAIVGGILAGTAGSIIGGTTSRSSTTSHSSITSFTCMIYVSSGPRITIDLIKNSNGISPESSSYRDAKESAFKISNLLDKVLQEKDRLTETISAEKDARVSSERRKPSIDIWENSFTKASDQVHDIEKNNKQNTQNHTIDSIPDFSPNRRVKKTLAVDETKRRIAVLATLNDKKQYVVIDYDNLKGFECREDNTLIYCYKDSGYGWESSVVPEIKDREEHNPIKNINIVIFLNDESDYTISLLSGPTNKGSRWYSMAKEEMEQIKTELYDICKDLATEKKESIEAEKNAIEIVDREEPVHSDEDKMELVLSVDEKVAALTKYKQLVDNSILTEEEFMVLKQKILGL